MEASPFRMKIKTPQNPWMLIREVKTQLWIWNNLELIHHLITLTVSSMLWLVENWYETATHIFWSSLVNNSEFRILVNVSWESRILNINWNFSSIWKCPGANFTSVEQSPSQSLAFIYLGSGNICRKHSCKFRSNGPHLQHCFTFYPI